VKTDCFLQGLDWLTLKEVEEEERGRNNTYTRAMGRDCRVRCISIMYDTYQTIYTCISVV